MYRKKILEKLKTIDEVPTMLSIALEIDKLTHDINASAKQISDIVRVDPALTGKVLKIANSPIYASTQRIVSLQQAIARLGLDELRRISISVAIINSFKTHYVDYKQFWIHSITVAYVSTYLREISNVNDRLEELYSASILHDVGVIILDQYFTDVYKKVFDIAAKKQFNLELVEDKILGISHAEVGAFLMKKWNLPEAIIEPIRCHHHPQKAKSFINQTKILYLSNFICNNRGIDNGTNFFPNGFYNDIWEDLSLSIDEIDSIIEKVKDNVEKAKKLLKLGGV